MTRSLHPGSGVVLTLWRAAAGFRVAALALCLYLIGRWQHLYAHPALAVWVGVAMVFVTGGVVLGALRAESARTALVLTDVVVCAVLTLLSRAAQHGDQFRGGMPTLTSVWAAGPAIEAGLLLGVVAGTSAAVVQFAVSVVVREGYDGRTLLNGLILLIVGVVAGYLATVSARVERQREAAAAAAARVAERETLARSIHDGVLQVLGLVHRRGAEASGEWAELGREAAIQEAALRALITSRLADKAGPSLTADLLALRSDRVTVSVPDGVVELPEPREVLDAVRAALQNVALHAGPDAHAWVLLEDLGDEVAISVRDDGVGMAAGRIAEADAQGRLGVAQSIKGRIRDLGGRVVITSTPGGGAEIEIVVPRRRRDRADHA